MNAHQRRKQRRANPFWYGGCNRQGYSGTTQYPDLMCTDGYMTDMDGDGVDPSVARPPCPHCKPEEHKQWVEDCNEC